MRELLYHKACPMCGGGRQIKIYTLDSKKNELIEKKEFEMMKCSNCNQVYLNPWVVGSEFEDSISVTAKVLDTAIKECLITQDLKPINNKLKSAYPELLYLTSKYYSKEKKVLDLGCGSGLSSLALQVVGYKVEAIEANTYLAQSAQALGISVKNVLFSDYEGEKFEQVTINSVIEHVHDPLQLLFDIKNNILDKNGKIIVTCPNIEGTQTISEGSSFGVFHWGHVWYFSENTLQHLMEKAGFELIEYYRPNFALSGVDENVRTYVKNILGLDINIYGAVAGIFGVK